MTVAVSRCSTAGAAATDAGRAVPERPARMDRWTAVGLLLLVAWAVPTFAFAPAPGWVHLLLTAGVFLVIYGAVARGTARGR